ncbi:lactonase family protein [Bacteroides ihuae]|uniref:lactonase family protein n=1 Tax=Bacteroides ihuae TaxID=1852362 RepID=UPI0008DAAC0A|nr:lactonase family protein [Bacteroides ihuae]
MVKEIISICTIGMLATSCQLKKANQQEHEATNGELTMLVGTYTSGSSKGIYTFRFNMQTGVATPLSEVKVSNPSYLIPSEDGKFVYAVSEQGDETAALSAFALNKEKGTLNLLNTQKTMGADPCYVTTNGQYVVTANYSGGSISAFPIKEDGSLLQASSVITFEGSGLDPERQKTPHLHCVRFTPDGKYLFADDLGSDKIHKFNVNQEANAVNKKQLLSMGAPLSFKLKPGSGPRHLTFAPNAKFAYLINELSGKVTAFEYADGKLKEIQSIAADTVGARGSADIHISPDGEYLYASNRLKADGIAIFRISKTDGTLVKVGYQSTGIHPRNFNITPNGKYLLVACRDSNVIQVFERNSETGLLTDIQKDIKLDKPVCIQFVN